LFVLIGHVCRMLAWCSPFPPKMDHLVVQKCLYYIVHRRIDEHYKILVESEMLEKKYVGLWWLFKINERNLKFSLFQS
jgi:hypothetical protein